MLNTPLEENATVRHIREVAHETPWLCAHCAAILGIVDGSKKTLRIKYKDLYVQITGGIVVVLCRRCGASNTLTDTLTDTYDKLS